MTSLDDDTNINKHCTLDNSGSSTAAAAASAPTDVHCNDSTPAAAVVTAAPAMDPMSSVGDVGEVVGFGRWQLQVFAFFMAAAFFSTWENVSLPFFAFATTFSCADSLSVSNSSSSDPCFVNDTSTTPCTHFVHDTSFFRRSMVSEWDLVCSRAWMPAFSQTAYMIGMLVAALCAGYAADRFGRRNIIMCGFCLEILSGFYSAYAPDVYHFFASRFLMAFGQTARFITGMILGNA